MWLGRVPTLDRRPKVGRRNDDVRVNGKHEQLVEEEKAIRGMWLNMLRMRSLMVTAVPCLLYLSQQHVALPK